jgi:crotonobetainyl-CoA:carnitine CoA-transferase CaiB-like acyl-CoA transferase
VVNDPQLIANDGFVDVDEGALRSVNGPVTFSGVRPRDAWVPTLGQHTDEVIDELRQPKNPNAGPSAD